MLACNAKRQIAQVASAMIALSFLNGWSNPNEMNTFISVFLCAVVPTCAFLVGFEHRTHKKYVLFLACFDVPTVHFLLRFWGDHQRDHQLTWICHNFFWILVFHFWTRWNIPWAKNGEKMFFFAAGLQPPLCRGRSGAEIPAEDGCFKAKIPWESDSKTISIGC